MRIRWYKPHDLITPPTNFLLLQQPDDPFYLSTPFGTMNTFGLLHMQQLYEILYSQLVAS